MSGALRFTRIKVQNVGILGERDVEFRDLSSTINVISGPNECGKSSIVRALRAALFQRHGSGHETIKALQPHGSKAAPQVEVDFEIDGTAYQLEKRFLKKATARLRSRDGTIDLADDEADVWLFERLGARPPAKKGVNFDDMGVWGLLWVNQDAHATDQPSEMMGDHVRGSLSRTIGTLVGNVLGGEQGVALRRAIDDEHARYWTAKTDEATSVLAGARRTVEALKTTAAQLKAREDETTQLAERITLREREIEGLDAELAQRRDELAACEAAVGDGDAIERARDEAVAALVEAERARAAAEERYRVRVDARARLEEATQSLAGKTSLADSLRAEGQRRQTVLLGLVDSADASRREVDATQVEADGLRRRLDGVNDRAALERLEASLAEARALDASIRSAEDACRRLPDDDALASLVELDAERAKHLEHHARYATRVIVRRGDAEEVTPVPTRRTIALGEAGSLTIDPPREGFVAARDAWRASRAKLLGRLDALRLASVSAAREHAAEHARLAEEIDRRRGRMAELAPRGFTALARECDAADRTHAADAQQRVEAAKFAAESDALRQEIAAITVDEEAVRALIDLDAKVRTFEALEAGSAVRVTVRPLSAVRVQIGARETPRLLTEGAEVRRSVLAPTTLIVDDRVQIEIDPGTSIAAGSEASARELATRLDALGVESVEAARALLRSRERHRERLAQAETLLREKAPDGLDALDKRGARAAKALEELRQRRDSAQATESELARLDAERARLPMRADDFSDLDLLDRRCFADEPAVRRLAGRVVAAEGAAATEIAGREDLVEPLSLRVGDVEVVIEPGEVLHDVDLPVLDRELSSRYRALAVSSLAEARQAHRTWVATATQLDADRRRLAQIAPQGIALLDAEVSKARARIGADAVETSSREAIEADLALAQRHLNERRLSLVSAEARRDQARGEADQAAAHSAKAESARVDQFARHGAMADQLRDDAAVTSDAALREALDAARVTLEARRARHEDAARACDDAMPEMRRADRDRARTGLDDVSRRLTAEREALARERGTLEGRLGEAYHEQRGATEASLVAAEGELARVERDGAAAKLLRDTAARAFGDAQSALMKPVSDEAMPLLRMIRPGTTFRMNKDTLQLEEVARNGVAEEFKDLSGGAREQLAVVVRIALAKVFARQHRALPLILDDILGWTDDLRLRAMLNVIERTSQDLQVILLTCHPARFRGLAGSRTYALDAMKGGA